VLANEITLHIGVHKTATTLIQRSLKTLRSQLAAQGVAYVDRGEMSLLPALHGWRAFRDPTAPVPELRPQMPAFGVHRPDLAAAFTDELRALAARRCAEVASSSGDSLRHLLMSNETLVGSEAPDFGAVYRPRAVAALGHVLEALEPTRTHLVLYVRRQDTLIESQYMQRIHDGEVHDFADFAARATADTFIQYQDLADRLRRIDAVVTVRVRPFEAVAAGPARFVADLLRPFDLDLDLTVLNKRRANPSYTAPALVAALAINPLLEGTEQLRATRKFLRRTFPASRYPPPQLFTDRERRRVLEMYAAANRAFFERELPDAPVDSYADDEATARLSQLV